MFKFSPIKTSSAGHRSSFLHIVGKAVYDMIVGQLKENKKHDS